MVLRDANVDLSRDSHIISVSLFRYGPILYETNARVCRFDDAPVFGDSLCKRANRHQPAAGKDYSLRDGTLWCGTRAVLQNIPSGFTIVNDPTHAGVFLKLRVADASARIESALGTVANLRRFTSSHRDEPWWMVPAAGRTEQEVRLETQWLLGETDAGDCVMLVPLMDGPFVFTLSGEANGLKLTGETADPAVTGTGGVALFVSIGTDPYAMADAGASAVMKHLGTGKLRKQKPLPDFVNYFGWCTWDSFYKEVSADKVPHGAPVVRRGRGRTAAAHPRRRLAGL